jgi:hypothetical protein
MNADSCRQCGECKFIRIISVIPRGQDGTVLKQSFRIVTAEDMRTGDYLVHRQLQMKSNLSDDEWVDARNHRSYRTGGGPGRLTVAQEWEGGHMSDAYTDKEAEISVGDYSKCLRADCEDW